MYSAKARRTDLKDRILSGKKSELDPKYVKSFVDDFNNNLKKAEDAAVQNTQRGAEIAQVNKQPVQKESEVLSKSQAMLFDWSLVHYGAGKLQKLMRKMRIGFTKLEYNSSDISLRGDNGGIRTGTLSYKVGLVTMAGIPKTVDVKLSIEGGKIKDSFMIHDSNLKEDLPFSKDSFEKCVTAEEYPNLEALEAKIPIVPKAEKSSVMQTYDEQKVLQ